MSVIPVHLAIILICTCAYVCSHQQTHHRPIDRPTDRLSHREARTPGAFRASTACPGGCDMASSTHPNERIARPLHGCLAGGGRPRGDAMRALCVQVGATSHWRLMLLRVCWCAKEPPRAPLVTEGAAACGCRWFCCERLGAAKCCQVLLTVAEGRQVLLHAAGCCGMPRLVAESCGCGCENLEFVIVFAPPRCPLLELPNADMSCRLLPPCCRLPPAAAMLTMPLSGAECSWLLEDAARYPALRGSSRTSVGHNLTGHLTSFRHVGECLLERGRPGGSGRPDVPRTFALPGNGRASSAASARDFGNQLQFLSRGGQEDEAWPNLPWAAHHLWAIRRLSDDAATLESEAAWARTHKRRTYCAKSPKRTSTQAGAAAAAWLHIGHGRSPGIWLRNGRSGLSEARYHCRRVFARD